MMSLPIRVSPKFAYIEFLREAFANGDKKPHRQECLCYWSYSICLRTYGRMPP
jgi:hypothetical protein